MSQGDELNQTIEEIAQGGPGIAGPGSSIKHPYDELDRWLLAALQRLGAIDAAAFAANRSVQTSGAADPALTAPQVEAWLRSASRRGLLTPQTVDLGGGPIHPPVWFLSDAGRERLRATRTPIDRIPVKRWRQGAVRLRRHLPGGRPSWNAVLAALAESDVQWDDRPLPPDRHPRPIVKASVAADDAEADRLLQERVGRIVVLMLENRSFDHMLGYLRLQGNKEVEGLTGGSEQFNEHQGRRYAPRRLASTRLPKNLDPGHSIAEVADQLEVENGRPNAGFVRNFATLEPEQPELVMGYHDGSQLPVYDYLAHNACICDHWFSSVPGSTWVNRLFALCGRADAEQEGILDGPLWDIPSFPRHLDAAGAEWRWYSHDPATLRVADGEYRNPLKGLRPENFRYFNRRMVSDMEQADDGLRVREDGSFLDHARSGKLPPVSWIDPNFIDLSFTDRNSNDDHPPSDVRAAQALVLTVLRAIAEGPVEQLSETLLIVTYDEHGGFYDHVEPPVAEPPDGNAGPGVFRRYGVRVPAFVVSPWVEPGSVSHETFDHTSIIRTVLQRFAPEAVDEMGKRVAKAKHLGHLLTRDEPAPMGDYAPAVQAIAEWQARSAGDAVLASPAPSPAEVEAPPPLEGFPAEMVEASRLLRGEGHKLPAAQP